MLMFLNVDNNGHVMLATFIYLFIILFFFAFYIDVVLASSTILGECNNGDGNINSTAISRFYCETLPFSFCVVCVIFFLWMFCFF